MLPYINRYLRANSEWRQITSPREWCLVSTEAETAHWFLDERDVSFLFQRIEGRNDTCRHDTIKFPNRRPRYWEHSKANGCGFYEVIHRIQGYSNKHSTANFQHVLMFPRIFLERRRHRLHIMLCTGWPLCLLLLQKCEQHRISFSYRTNVKGIINDTCNYTTEKRTVVSVWSHESSKKVRFWTRCVTISRNYLTKKPLNTDTSAMKA
jgi:hypothetical protein